MKKDILSPKNLFSVFVVGGIGSIAIALILGAFGLDEASLKDRISGRFK